MMELAPAVGAAIIEFLHGPLSDNPHRVGQPLRGRLTGAWSARRGEYWVIYRIDDGQVVVTVLSMRHRRDAYRG
jgi:mRNA-degrading endonuclease RelE of RelBE toxin-antitoxin system